MRNKLAIVIPAFKSQFFKETLKSISSQTNKDFCLYIGDDNSPEDLYSIINEFVPDLKVVYQKFTNNLGGENLVKHWNRCLEMVNDEEWIWLFSDDDLMDSNCVQNFYDTIKNLNNVHFDVFRFNINVIDNNNIVIGNRVIFPDVLKVEEFIYKKSSGKIKSYIVEYIFRKEKFNVYDGFVEFPIAWHSDEATVIKFALKSGIKTIKNSCVSWRSSSFNLTPNSKDLKIVVQKIDASLLFVRWLIQIVKTNNLILKPFTVFWLAKRFTYELSLYKAVIDIQEINIKLKEYLKVINYNLFYPFFRILFNKYNNNR
ncbi:glycosyltransferase [Sphingobacterium sp. HJSM2_6]|uniref:glycosyltransferase n=1 Tax=Sphingobacterium sp. HJSM2_6 TaxID=3366264 RepID=UPI003BC0BF4B